jgi:hypothetical protein
MLEGEEFGQEIKDGEVLKFFKEKANKKRIIITLVIIGVLLWMLLFLFYFLYHTKKKFKSYVCKYLQETRQGFFWNGLIRSYREGFLANTMMIGTFFFHQDDNEKQR